MPKGMVALDDNTLAQVVGGEYTGSVFLYTVRQGENLLVLSRKFNTTVSVLQELNPTVTSIGAGTRLLVPLNA